MIERQYCIACGHVAGTCALCTGRMKAPSCTWDGSCATPSECKYRCQRTPFVRSRLEQIGVLPAAPKTS